MQVFLISFNLAYVLKGFIFEQSAENELFDVINKPDVIRGRSRTPKTSKVEFYMKTT